MAQTCFWPGLPYKAPTKFTHLDAMVGHLAQMDGHGKRGLVECLGQPDRGAKERVSRELDADDAGKNRPNVNSNAQLHFP